MRRRVMLPLLILGLLAVLAIIVPVAEGIAVSRTQELQLQRASSIDQLVQRAQAATASGDATQLERYLGRFFETYGEAVLVVDAAGQPLASAGDLSTAPDLDALVLSAARTVPQTALSTVYPWSPDTQLIAEPSAGDASGASGAVVLAVDLGVAKTQIAERWMLVALAGGLLLLALLAASLAWTSWVLRPVRALDTAANALAEQREPKLADATGPPELRRLSESFARMSRSVEDALEQQRGFVAEASHQLRNPLAAIRLRIDALPRDDADEAELEAVGRDLDRLEHVVERMLVLANAEHRATAEASGRRTGFSDGASREHVTSATMLADPHRAALAAAGLRVEVRGAEELRVVCRKSDLEEIVENVLENAQKYAGEGATVTVGLEREAAGDAERAAAAVLTIADDGPGLSDADLAQLGTRFWRSTAHRAQPGTGLGVAIVGELARANQGTVEFDRAPEGGLRVRVRLAVAS